ncbi:MAG: LacI family DNA-binding transcriptional regulator [Burkholderiaceae bacterium]|nr:LacI family DNA-binding transcriptional regulator [Microbacteriaceae bacterium]
MNTVRDRPSITDVAAHAGVSIKTVSRVVNAEASVLPATRARVDLSISELGYVPNSSARTLKSGVGDAVGVVIDTIADPFFAALVSVIETRALAEDMGVLFASTGFDEGRERDQLLRLAGQQVRGIILAPVAQDHGYLERYRASTPIVMVDRPRDTFDSVVVDDIRATRAAIDQFVRLGHTRIAFIGFDARFSTTTHRYEGYRQALAEHGIPLDHTLAPQAAAEVTDAKVATLGLFGLASPPTAIFAANPRAGIGVVDALHTTGHTGVAVISFGDFAFASVIRPAVSYIDQDPFHIGNAAIERLITLINEPGTQRKRIVLDTNLVARGSGEIRATA